MAQARSCPLTLPRSGDVGSVLRATAMYDDERGQKTRPPRKIRLMLSVKLPSQTSLRHSPTRTWLWRGVQTAQTREVAENTPAGTNIGAAVVASDPDVLTYSLDDDGEDADGVRHQAGDRSADH